MNENIKSAILEEAKKRYNAIIEVEARELWRMVYTAKRAEADLEYAEKLAEEAFESYITAFGELD